MIQSETLELLEWPRLCQHLATFTATKLGAIATHHLQIPSTRAETIQLLAQTQEVYKLETLLTQGLSFDGIEDIGDSLERSELGGILSGGELLGIATTLAGVRKLRRAIDGYESEYELSVLPELVADLRTYPELEQEIHRCIDDRGDVTDRASPKLAGIREKMHHLRDRIDNILRGILQRKANAIQQPIITQRGDRFVIPVKAPQKDAVPGIVHDTSTTGSTLYIEPNTVVNLNNQMRQLQRQAQREEEAIRQALTEQVAEVKEDLEQLLAIATIIDLATARARYSLWLGANPPQFTDPDSDQPMTMRQLRHPLLVWQQQHEQGSSVVPIDVNVRPPVRVVAITGPNTGGKTVTLKTLGLAALMAKVGLFIPANDPVELPWFEQILADIGDEQSLEQSLSTFSGHIRRIIRILESIEGTLNWEQGTVIDDFSEDENKLKVKSQKSKLIEGDDFSGNENNLEVDNLSEDENKLKVKIQNSKVIEGDDFSEDENNLEVDNLSEDENKLKVKIQNSKVIEGDDFSEDENNLEVDNLSENENQLKVKLQNSKVIEGDDLSEDENNLEVDNLSDNENKLKVKLQNSKVIEGDDLSGNENNLEVDNYDVPSSPFPVEENFRLSPTLVLLDEVGAGTDPTEGSALAISLLQYLADNALLTVATTHFGELKALKYEDERFENASVEFDTNSLQPTYRLLWGIPGRSNAMTIAGRLGLKQDIIDRAQDYVGGDSEDVNQVIAGLEEQRQKQETKAKEASELLQETEYLHREVARKASALKERERELKLAQEVAVQEKIAEAKAEIATVIRNLQQGPLTARNAQKATNAINEISEKYLPSRTPPPKKPSFMPKEGDRIRIPKIGQTAEVLTAANENDELTVKFGIMKMTVNLREIESLDGEKVESFKKSKNVESQKSKKSESKSKESQSEVTSSGLAVRTSQNSIDIRGSRVADAQIEVDRALSKAIEYGLLWIIHGKGTGKLRQGIHEFLQEHPLVERYELAARNDGGSGVTIAHLK
ncbi:MAG: endonuclease MutS2 [Okeania sp. SIO2F4]|uniref:endonuclease MutS2 n=1 Tax=Okeania sp. SIO2F4 TaxID=2607790 RepID=UPI00142B98C3|nr:endonuclease MutS2 [Okeania sp. SIO2F4]NES06085.1 endonuclease MutS2 [Okeania sp. SIO2F4]